MCIDIARDAMQMYSSGASVKAIRAATEKKWGSQYPSTMHTPMPK